VLKLSIFKGGGKQKEKIIALRYITILAEDQIIVRSI
jgi:hypothetical protein